MDPRFRTSILVRTLKLLSVELLVFKVCPKYLAIPTLSSVFGKAPARVKLAFPPNHLALWAGKEAVSPGGLPSAFPGLSGESLFIVFESEETDRLRKWRKNRPLGSASQCKHSVVSCCCSPKRPMTSFLAFPEHTGLAQPANLHRAEWQSLPLPFLFRVRSSGTGEFFPANHFPPAQPAT